MFTTAKVSHLKCNLVFVTRTNSMNAKAKSYYRIYFEETECNCCYSRQYHCFGFVSSNCVGQCCDPLL
ncbi:Hypothetical predicted protein [Octopus vulgaris]|uniref:Uncharacterized protein n=1 Tax=Octopus vulgaris TaxID=6645 RepID=A0AA36AN20_OCTVU|nr:Hypothetical predicted protein [Octopus vulgaris]